MPFGILKSVAHNIADSLACGMGFPIGVFITNIFGEAENVPGGSLTVNFLTGSICGGTPSPELARAVGLYRDALPDFCASHGVDIGRYRVLEACYSSGPLGRDFPLGRQFVVTVEDDRGRRSTDCYVGLPGKRIRARPQRYEARVY